MRARTPADMIGAALIATFVLIVGMFFATQARCGISRVGNLEMILAGAPR